jgi:hypothetical protein
LYRNNGDGTLTDITRSSSGIVDPGYYSFGVLFSDLDDHRWLDIFVANDSVPNFCFETIATAPFRRWVYGPAWR